MRVARNGLVAARQIGAARVAERKTYFEQAHARFLEQGGFAGRDENGKPTITRNPGTYRIVVRGWRARMGFRREDRSQINETDWRSVEANAKKGRLPLMTVWMETHLIMAVRTLKHLRQNYERETERADGLLAELDQMNVALAKTKNNHTSEEFNGAIGLLETVGEKELTKRHAVVRRIVARARLEESVQMLEEAKEMPFGYKRDRHVSRACAVFTSLRNRIGQWRNRQIAYLVAYNEQREAALRSERDRWLGAQLERFAEQPEKVAQYIAFDEKRLRALATVTGMMETREARSILGYIVRTHGLFRPLEYLLGQYRVLYRQIRDGERANARETIEKLTLSVQAETPRFILEELQKEPDAYLDRTIDRLQQAVDALEQKDFAWAQQCFTEARQQLASTDSS